MAEADRPDRRMSEQEALMWALERDPVLRSSFANVTLLDRPPELARLKERLRLAAEVVPRLHQRVVDSPGPGTPVWDDDPMFDLDHHVRRVGVPAPGGLREVLDLAALLAGDPFDPARPLWQFVVLEGMADGRAAMVQKLHHTITDGEGGVRLSAIFLDLERDAEEPMVRVEPADAEAGAGGARAVIRAVADGVRLPMGVARRAVSDAIDAVTHPLEAPARASEAWETAQSLLRQVAVGDGARSPLWTERSLRRHLEVLSIPLDEAKKAAANLGGTVNDLFVTGAATAAGAYHRALGRPVDELRMAMPVSTRAGGAVGGNAFAPTRVVVPTGPAAPAERFAAVHQALGGAKGERAVGLAAQLAGLLNVLPDPLLARFARQQVGTVDFTTSNVRGAPFALYLAGAEILSNHPIGPLAGTALNLTTLSYRGRLDMGCVVDTAAVGDPGLLAALLGDAYAELLALA